MKKIEISNLGKVGLQIIVPTTIVLVFVGVAAVFVNQRTGTEIVTNNMTDSHSHTYTIDTAGIPLGDGKLSTTPKEGYVYSCVSTFTGGGAWRDGEWIEGDTWDLSKKVSVQGSVSWPSAVFSAVVEGTKRILSGNSLPVGEHTGIFPIAHTDPAYNYDRNPNTITEQNVNLSLPVNPTFAESASCVQMGPVGYTLSGVAIYNAIDDQGRDAVAHETQDVCSGHPQEVGQYHYHGPSDCMPHADENNALIGYALDGFGVFSRFDVNGREYTNDDLDECHGVTSEIEWNGQKVNMYHYVLTAEYPYTVGCFRGTPVSSGMTSRTEAKTGAAGAAGAGLGQSDTPPQEAFDACIDKADGDTCTVHTPGGNLSGACHVVFGNTVSVCVPD